MHTIDDNWKLKKFLLDLGQLPYTSSNNEIISIWKAIFDDYNLESSRLSGVVLDGGANFQLAGRKFVHNTTARVIWCFCHRMHLVIKYLFKKGPPELKNIHTRACNIVSKFARSWKFSYTFRVQQEKFGSSGTLIQSIPTRWNTCFDMFRSLVKNKEAVQQALEEENFSNLGLTDTEWLIMEVLVQWSKCITETIDFMQSDTQSRIDCAFPRLAALQHEAQKLITKKKFPGQDRQNINTIAFAINLGKALKCALNQYFPINEVIVTGIGERQSKKSYNLLVFACWLNPAFNSFDFLPPEEASLHQIYCQTKAQKYINNQRSIRTPTATTTGWHANSLNEMRQQNQSTPNRIVSEVDSEIKRFQDEHAESDDSLEWWKKNVERFPLLSQIAKKILCIPPSSATSERSFSASGLIITPLRNGLDEKTARKLTRIAFNKKSFE